MILPYHITIFITPFLNSNNFSVILTSHTPGYLLSSRKSLRISIDEYQPVKGVAGNCNPPISVISQETPGSGYHSNPRPLMAGKLVR